MEEPELLGAVVETEDGAVWMLSPHDTFFPKYRWVGRRRDGSADSWQWKSVADLSPVLRFEGFTPSPKEPILPCAVVRDKDGHLFVKSDGTAQPWRRYTPPTTDHSNVVWFGWSEIADPEVIFAGVEVSE